MYAQAEEMAFRDMTQGFEVGQDGIERERFGGGQQQTNVGSRAAGGDTNDFRLRMQAQVEADEETLRSTPFGVRVRERVDLMLAQQPTRALADAEAAAISIAAKDFPTLAQEWIELGEALQKRRAAQQEQYLTTGIIPLMRSEVQPHLPKPGGPNDPEYPLAGVKPGKRPSNPLEGQAEVARRARERNEKRNVADPQIAGENIVPELARFYDYSKSDVNLDAVRKMNEAEQGSAAWWQAVAELPKK